MIYKICTSCGKKVEEGKACPCWSNRKKERDRLYDRTKRDIRATSFYGSAAWMQARERILMRDQIDVYMYMTQGRTIPADTVHHIVPLREDWAKRLDPMNLMGLNHETHSRIEREYIRKGTKVMSEMLRHMLFKFLEEK